MFSKKAFTITEILTTVAITAVVFGGVSMSISPFSENSDMFSGEHIFTSKIRSEKVTAIAGGINCSKSTLSFGKNFFELFYGSEKNFSCDKKLSGKIKEIGGIISFPIKEDVEVQIYKNGSQGGEIYFKKIEGEISFQLENDFSYKIFLQKNDIIEESELIFFNEKPLESVENEGVKVFVSSISGKNFKKEEIKGDNLHIIFVGGNPKSKLFLRGEEINDAQISLKTHGNQNTVFEFFSANIFGKKDGSIDVLRVLK